MESDWRLLRGFQGDVNTNRQRRADVHERRRQHRQSPHDNRQDIASAFSHAPFRFTATSPNP
jgi:hypothetical protein